MTAKLKRISLKNFLSFLMVVSIVLAPLTLGGSANLRIGVLVLLPALVLILWIEIEKVLVILSGWFGFAIAGFSILLISGYMLENDVLPGLHDYRVLTAGNLVVIPLVIVVSVLVGAGRRYEKGVVAGLGIGLLIQLVQVFLIPPSDFFREFTRSSGLMGDPNILLLHLIPVFCFWASLIRRTSLNSTYIIGIFIVLCLATLRTLSRAGLVTIIVVIILVMSYLVVSLLRFRTRKVIGLAGLIIGFLAFILIAGQFSKDEIGQGVVGFQSRISERVIESGYLGDRFELYRTLFDAPPSAIFDPLGAGYFSLLGPIRTLPHNTFIDIYAICGLFGIGIVMWLYLRPVLASGARIWIDTRKPHLLLSGILLFSSLVTQFLLLGTLSVLTFKVHWMILGLAWGKLIFSKNAKLHV